MNKSVLKTTKVIFILMLVGYSVTAFARLQVEQLSAPKIITIAQTLNGSGTLEIAKNGYVYIKISPEFVNNLYSLLVNKLDNPSCLQAGDSRVGAHISVFYPDDLPSFMRKNMNSFQGEVFHFSVESLQKTTETHVRFGRVYKKVFYDLKVYSPSLVSFIKQYKPNDLDARYLHITIAEEKYVNDQCELARAYE